MRNILYTFFCVLYYLVFRPFTKTTLVCINGGEPSKIKYDINNTPRLWYDFQHSRVTINPQYAYKINRFVMFYEVRRLMQLVYKLGIGYNQYGLISISLH